MWIKWIATLVAFGALVQSAVACPSQCSCDQTTVYCRSLRLTSVPAGIPTDRQNLWLYNNQITKLEPGVFDSLTQLTVLSLHTNQLQALPEGVFGRLGNLQRLDLRDNQLKSIPRGAFDNLKSLTGIWLSDNPWDCQCTDILYLSGWVAQHSGIVGEGWPWRHSPDSAKCSGTNTPVRAVTEASTSPSKCPGYVATTTTPTTTTPEFIPETTTSPQPVITTQKPKPLINFNCTSILERKNDGGDCGKPACTTLLNCANFLSCLCSTCALCRKR
uniref:Variable lymphocyte receptor n=1 Tax=Lethenteron appendix TaxID=104630 RepID=Q4KP12_LETAP|nr:variable lymphocyte receptor [Lethenteron appendix]